MLSIEQDAPRTPAFDPWRFAATSPLRVAVEEVTHIALNVEAHRNLRQRARRPSAMKVFNDAVEAIVSNALYWYRLGHPSFRITRSKRALSRKSRYTSPLLTESLPDILDLLASPEVGFIELVIGERNPFGENRQTEVSPTARLLKRFEAQGLSTEDTDRREGEELVLLKGDKGRVSLAELMEYEDTPDTLGYRDEVRRINAAIRAASIEYTGEACVDERDTYMRRHFNRGSFGSGGRLCGGYWQALPKQDRLANILIDGEPVVGLDFKAMVASLAYAYVDAEVPPHDAYGLPIDLPRPAVKQLFSACLFAQTKDGTPFTQWPKGIESKGLKVSAAIRAITEVHPKLAPLFFQGRGHSLMFAESEILIDALLRLLDQGIVALPVHDCLVVAESQLTATRQAMTAAFAYHCNGRIPQIAEERTNEEISC